MNSNYKRLNYLHSNLSLTAFFKHFLDTEEPDSLFSITAKLAEVTKMILDYSDSDRYQQGLESKPELDKLQKKQEEYQAQLHKLQGRQVQERLESIQLKLSNLSSDKLDRINRIDHHQSDSMQLFSETMDMRRFQRDIEQSSRSQLIFPRVQFSSTGSIKQLCQNLSGSLGDNVHYLFHDPETGQDRVLIISGRESEPRIMSFDQYHKNDELKQSASKQVMLYDNTTMQGGDFKSISSVDSTVDQEDFSQVIVDDVFMEGFEDVQFSTSDYYQMTARARKTGARHSILYTRKSSDVFELDRTAKESRNLEGWIQKNLSCRLYNDLNHMYEVDRETFNDTISHTLETICENKNEIDLNNEDAVNALAEELVHTICENLPSNDICLDKPIRQWNIGYRLAQYINFRNSRHNGESKEI